MWRHAIGNPAIALARHRLRIFEGADSERLDYRPALNVNSTTLSLSIYDILEHLAITIPDISIMAQRSLDNPAKRRRLSLLGVHPPTIEMPRETHSWVTRSKEQLKDWRSDEDSNITITSTSKLAGQTVAPFLAKHIPEQYAPLGGLEVSAGQPKKDANSKYCYRHRPDLKCRRQANEPSMDQLQRVREWSVPLHIDIGQPYQ